MKCPFMQRRFYQKHTERLKQDLKLAENLNIKIIKIRHNINNSFIKNI